MWLAFLLVLFGWQEKGAEERVKIQQVYTGADVSALLILRREKKKARTVL